MKPSSYAKDSNQMIRHVVCFQFKPDATTEQIKKVENEFSALKGKIPGIMSLEWEKTIAQKI